MLQYTIAASQPAVSRNARISGILACARRKAAPPVERASNSAACGVVAAAEVSHENDLFLADRVAGKRLALRAEPALQQFRAQQARHGKAGAERCRRRPSPAREEAGNKRTCREA